MKHSTAPPHTPHGILRDIIQTETIHLTVQGICMEPYLADGSQVHVRAQSIYWPGDIVVLQAPNNQYLVHRMIGMYLRAGQLRFLTQADSASIPDRAVAHAEILGKVIGRDCHPHAVKIPLYHRIKALSRFVCFALQQIRGQRAR